MKFQLSIRHHQARYMTETGWSKRYVVEVTFMTGQELNEATNSHRFSMFSVYATIFWGEGQATVIKLSSHLICGTEVSKSCIKNSISDLKGKDQDGDDWKICVSDYCF
jgi:hypothetical protein